MVDVKAEESNDESMIRLTKCSADESHETTARIKYIDREPTAAQLLGWLLWVRIKHSHRKITMTHTQTTCPNCISLSVGKKGARPAEFRVLSPVFVKWKNSVNAAKLHIDMLIGPQALKSVNSIEKIRPRMMPTTFNGNPSTTIISCYSPINFSEGTGLIAFYNELSSLVRSLLKH